MFQVFKSHMRLVVPMQTLLLEWQCSCCVLFLFSCEPPAALEFEAAPQRMCISTLHCG